MNCSVNEFLQHYFCMGESSQSLTDILRIRTDVPVLGAGNEGTVTPVWWGGGPPGRTSTDCSITRSKHAIERSSRPW